MTEQPKMTLPNGDVLVDGDWGVTRDDIIVQVSWNPRGTVHPWRANGVEYTPSGRIITLSRRCMGDIIARAPAPSTRPADEMDLTALCKPVMAWHPETLAEMKAWIHGWELLGVHGEWIFLPEPRWLQGTCYRAKPAPAAIRAAIPWDFLVSDIQWVAMDEDGSWYGFFDSVSLDGDIWCGDGVHDLSPFTFPQGNEHWTETLQQRPDTRTEGSI